MIRAQRRRHLLMWLLLGPLLVAMVVALLALRPHAATPASGANDPAPPQPSLTPLAQPPQDA